MDGSGEMRELFWVGVGGFFGAVARYLVSVWARGWAEHFPVGTLAANVLGSFALGFFASVFSGDAFRLTVLVGFLGSFTTFSAFSYESVLLWQSGRWSAFLLNAALNVFVCLAAAAFGIAVGRAVK